MNNSDVIFWRGYAMQCAKSLGIRGADTEDATQEALIAALKAWDKADDPKALLPVVIRREIQDWLKHQFRRRCLRLEEIEEQDGDESQTERNPDYRDRCPMVTVSFDPHEMIDAVAALNDLPIRQRMTIEMQAEGYSPAEIAEALSVGGKPVDVRSTRKRARRTLRATLGDL